MPTTKNKKHDVIDNSNQAVMIHADRINKAWQKAVSSIIETGQLLIDAKEGKHKIPHGEFTKLFDSKIGKLPFSERTAQCLMQIARHPILSNEAYRPVLPPHCRTLVILSRAPATQLESWLADGIVTAETEQVEAEALVNADAKPKTITPLPRHHQRPVRHQPVNMEEALKAPPRGTPSPPLAHPYVAYAFSYGEMKIFHLKETLKDSMPALLGDLSEIPNEDIVELKTLLHKAVEALKH
jgi:hypothetical protein